MFSQEDASVSAGEGGLRNRIGRMYRAFMGRLRGSWQIQGPPEQKSSTGEKSELRGLGLRLLESFPRLGNVAYRAVVWQRSHTPTLLRIELAAATLAIRSAKTIRTFAALVLVNLPGSTGKRFERYLTYRIESRNAEIMAYNRELKHRNERLQGHLDRYVVNQPVNVYLWFAQECHSRIAELEADVYVGHGVQSLPAAAILAQENGAKHFCDCIEIPSFFDRAVPVRWHPTNTHLLDCAFESYLRRADGVLTVGWALGDELRSINPSVEVIPNYRYREELVRSDRLRQLCGLEKTEELVLSLSTVATGFEAVLHAMAMLPEHIHLVSVGNFVPPEYEKLCRELSEQLGIEGRVHWFEPVPYSELTTTMSSADVGLIVRDPAIRNNAVSLPNRIFDYMFSSVPVCTPQIPDIAKIVAEESMGAVVPDMQPSSWAAGISEILAAKSEMKRNAIEAADTYTWDQVEDRLFDFLGRPKRVCYLGANNLINNNRTRRMARTLISKGVEVTVAFLRPANESGREETRYEDGIKVVPIIR